MAKWVGVNICGSPGFWTANTLSAPLKAITVERATPRMPGPLARASAKAFMPWGDSRLVLVMTILSRRKPRSRCRTKSICWNTTIAAMPRPMETANCNTTRVVRKCARAGISRLVGAQHRGGAETGKHQRRVEAADKPGQHGDADKTSEQAARSVK